MPTIISGAQQSDTALAANQMPSVDKILYLRYPMRSQFFNKLYFSDRAQRECTDATGKYSWFVDDLYPHHDTLSGAGIAGGATSENAIGLSNPTYFQAGDVLLVEDTEEMVYVDLIDGGNVDITSVDGSLITACTTGYVTKLYSRNLEVNTARTAVATQEEQIYNYLTIHSETVDMSSREQGAKHYTNGKSYEEQLEKRIIEVKQEFERYFMLSTKSGRDTTGASPWTYGKGFLGLVTTNRIGYTEVTENGFNDFLRQCFDNDGNEVRDFHMGSYLSADINKILQNYIRLTDVPVKEFGYDIMKYQTPFGIVNTSWNPRLDGGFSTKGFLIDWETIALWYMANDKKGSQKFRVEEDVETPGTSETKAKIYADIGFEIGKETTCGIYEKSV